MSGRRRSSGRGQSSLGYLFGNSDESEEQRHDHSKAVFSPWVSISGGGQSSLGYLFGSNAPMLQQQGDQESKLSSPPVCVPPYGVDDDQVIMQAENSPEKPLPLPSENRKSSYVYHKVDGQKSREFLLTGRPSTRVKSVPGGDSSIGYLFGDK